MIDEILMGFQRPLANIMGQWLQKMRRLTENWLTNKKPIVVTGCPSTEGKCQHVHRDQY